MNKKCVVVSLAMVFCLFFPLSSSGKDKYEKWMKEEVNLIITDAERAVFKKLKSDKEKDLFIQLFWARRDPTPETEENEFREEYYRRLEYARKAFIYGYKTGTATDMGKVYLFFGKPARVFRQSPRVVIWVYPSEPWMKLPKETFSVVFTAVETDWIDRPEQREKGVMSSLDVNGYVIDRSQTDFRVMEAFFSYPKRILLHPDLKELPRYRKAPQLPSASLEHELIERIRATGEDILQIPFSQKALLTKAENNSSYLTLLLRVEPGKEWEKTQEKMIVFGRIESEDHSYDFNEEVDLLEENSHFICQLGLPVTAGTYSLILGLITQDRKRYSIKKNHLEVPDFWSQNLALSSLLASPQVREEKPPGKKGEYNVFSLGRYSLLPRYDQVYTAEDSLNVFYYIYNIAVDANQTCSLLIEFELQKGEKTYKLNPQRRKQKLGKETALLEGTQIPLSALPESGEYILMVRVTDELAKKTVSQKLKFAVR